MHRCKNLVISALKFLRRNWVWTVAGALVALVMAYGSPAWAAPVAAPLNQTVPRPTPTPSDGPVATPTPLGDDGSDDDPADSGGSGDSGPDETASADPLLFLQQEGSAEAGYLATVNVAQLNVRSGPGVNSAVVSNVAQGAQVTVLFRNEDGTWWYVCCAPGMTADGWISADLVEPSFDRTQATTLLPLFGTDAPAVAASASTTATTQSTNTASAAAASVPASAAGGPLTLSASMTPNFVWQGQSVALRFLVTNPHAVDVTNVEFSDELPGTLEVVELSAENGGQTRSETTANGGTLVVVRWPRIPAGGSAAATVRVSVAPDLPAGAVIDNLFAVRSANAEYTTGALSVGMPPITLPDFQ